MPESTRWPLPMLRPARAAVAPAPARGAMLAPPSPEAPLAGLTLLAIEDSRFACDALRLMAQRSGARLRRAETLAEADHHLRVYRPDLVMLDPGLPDGDGLDLAARIAAAGPGAPPVLVISGRPDLGQAARAAGAAGFIVKPVAGLAAFRASVLACLPDRHWLMGHGGAEAAGDLPAPDPLALRDDLARVARHLATAPDARDESYLAGFVAGLARATGDMDLAEAAALGATQPGPRSMRALARAIGERLQRTPTERLIAPPG